MPEPSKSVAADALGALPEVQLELRQGGRSTPYAFHQVDFLIGTVPGCDLRVPGADLPAVLCLLARHPGGLRLRKLATTQLLLVNGQTVSQTELGDGDRITMGAVDLFVRLKPGKLGDRPASAVKSAVQSAVPIPASEKTARVTDLTADLERQRQELAAQRQELADIRNQLYQRYQERRDRLAGLQEAVDRAARKVQERKRLLDSDEKELERRKQTDGQRVTDLSRRLAEVEEQKRRLDAERAKLAAGQSDVKADVENKLTDLARREEALAGERRDIEARLRQYQADLLRLDRLQSSIEQRDKDLIARENTSAAKLNQLQKDSVDLEAEVVRLDAWRTELTDENERLKKQRAEQDVSELQLAQRSASLEGQQATMAALRTRLERLREEVRQQEQQVAEQRQRHEGAEQRLADERRAMEQLRLDLEMDRQAHEAERGQIVERSAVLDAAVANLNEAHDKFAEEQAKLAERSRELDAKQDTLTAHEGILQSRLQQLAEVGERLDAERAALRERTQALSQAEQVREALQEQLRRRAEDLGQRQKTLDEKLQECTALSAGVEALRAELERQHQEANTRLAEARADLTLQTEALENRFVELVEKETHIRQQFEQLQTLGKEVAGQRKALASERAAAAIEQQAWLDEQASAKTELDTLRKEAVDLQRRLPDLELHAGTTLERLTHAREQLRDHLAELHSYVHSCQEDLDQLRGRIQKDEAGLQEQEQSLRRSQEEHRLAMVAFRQQLIGWQGQIADMKRLLASDETRLERKEAHVALQVKELDQTTEKLAKQAEELQQRHEEVAGRRQEMDRHLVDMREWYRRKLRELAGIDMSQEVAEADLVEAGAIVPLPIQTSEIPASSPEEESALIPTGRNILSLTEPVDAGDRQLGETLAQLDLVDRDTLSALLVEARRQRRSLRQVLLAGGVVTVYQLALIEAGQVERLMIGPVRVIDRVRVTRSETIYRVFDPRRGHEAALRHLSPEEMKDAARVEEYRRCFTQTVLDDANLARTLEVLEVAGRPAVLQEWLHGLPSSDWPPLAAAPGVCFRLLTQAALGLSAIHKAGSVHGHLTDASMFLTGDGLLKITGLGEPSWLAGTDENGAVAEEFGAASPSGDLRALGRVVSGWCTPSGVRKGSKAKPLPESLVSILYRLNADGTTAYPSAAELLEDLDRAGADIPANAEAWDRLLRYVKEHGTPEALLKQSA